ncbi:adenylate kinase [Streptomyces sp. NPDC094472]|uniref:adenylate kinase n=1 Tax=unclassified Streptomyces TaxID=2593676 RepID=UPI003322FB8A
MRIVLIGPPGAGKGTQARFLAERFSIPVISAGDLFRVHVTAGTALGRKAREYMDAGALVPDEMTAAMMADRLAEEDAASGFLLDGFPRTVRQAELLHQTLVDQDAALDHVLAFEVPDDHVVRRLAARRTCGDCGLVQRRDPVANDGPSSCQACGGALQRRDDDQDEIVRNRLSVYAEQTVPLLRWYAACFGSLTRVNATGPVEEVTRRVLAAIVPSMVI